MCDCQFPVQVATAKVYLRRRPKKGGAWTVDFYSDCLLCGPQVERCDYHLPPPLASLVIVHQSYWRGERSGLVGLMKRREQGLLRGKEER